MWQIAAIRRPRCANPAVRQIERSIWTSPRMMSCDCSFATYSRCCESNRWSLERAAFDDRPVRECRKWMAARVSYLIALNPFRPSMAVIWWRQPLRSPTGVRLTCRRTADTNRPWCLTCRNGSASLCDQRAICWATISSIGNGIHWWGSANRREERFET